MERLGDYFSKAGWRRDLDKTYSDISNLYLSRREQYDSGLLLTGGWVLSALAIPVFGGLVPIGLTTAFLIAETANTNALRARKESLA